MELIVTQYLVRQYTSNSVQVVGWFSNLYFIRIHFFKLESEILGWDQIPTQFQRVIPI